ncbi:MAG: mechanosensitive ion channel family protein, partial [Xenococcaceae cyanobacterium]
VMLVKRGGIVIGFLLALTALEVSLGPILALVGGASFVLAFALQSNIGNFASGLMLMVYKPFDVGDEVQMGDVWGFVDSITLGGTKILSFSNQLITIPNNTVWSSVITNNTGTEVRGVSISFKIGYDSPIPKVKDVLLDIYKAHPLILDEPEAFMFPWQFKDSAIVILTTAFTKTENRWKVYEELFALIQERFAKEGIDMIDYSEVNLHYLSNNQIPTSGEMAQLTAQLSKEATPTPSQTI